MDTWTDSRSKRSSDIHSFVTGWPCNEKTFCSRTLKIYVQPDDAVDDFYPLPSSSSSKSMDMPSVTPPLRRSNRIRNPPDRYVPDNFH